jgi:hypothetical protein
MKITRQSNIKETSKITCDWLDQFARNMAKSANLEYLDTGDRYTINNSSNKFGTIEAKMDDIKLRIGFDALMAKQKMSNEKVASDGCGCSPKKNTCSCEIKTAELKHDQEDIELMRRILVYIQDLVKHESHLDRASIIGRCREEDGLHFHDLPINLSKLGEFIDGLISNESSEVLVSYVPPDPILSGNSDNERADYYQHAEPTI